MKQKIVIEVQMRCKKCQSKALKIAFEEDGVTSVTLKGERKNQMEIIGDGIIDAASLAEKLGKKVGCAGIVSVEEVKEKVIESQTTVGCDIPAFYKQPGLECYKIVSDSSPITCTIM